MESSDADPMERNEFQFWVSANGTNLELVWNFLRPFFERTTSLSTKATDSISVSINSV